MWRETENQLFYRTYSILEEQITIVIIKSQQLEAGALA
jgi:hypothetical protein